MLILKIILSGLIIFCAYELGMLISKKYIYRLQELDEIKGCFNIMETKIKFTYEPINEIFEEIAELSSIEVKTMFRNIISNIKELGAQKGWERGIEKSEISINKEDRMILKSFGKLLGQTDKEGQLSEISQITTLLERQIRQAEQLREKNEKFYKKMGLIAGIGIVVVLV